MVENLEYYKVFYYVGKNKSITAAAKELMISQPAVSQSIHQLEKNLGCSLFQRTSRGMKFTAEGDILYRYVERGVDLIDLGEQRLKQLQHLEAGEVRIGASDMTLRFFLLPYLEKFHEQYPGIKVTVTNGPTPETIEYLEDDRIDFGVISTPFSPSDGSHNRRQSDSLAFTGKEGLTYFPVSEIEDVFVAGRRFIQYKNRMLDFSDLEKIPLILLEGNSSTRSYIDKFLSEHGVDIQPEFELSTSDMIVQFALRNLGVGCVVKDFAKEHLDSGVLFELRFNSVLPKRQICVISDESRPLSIAASKLLELIKGEE
ncbi:MAG: LysR family transcriptional regulator [Butyrivibrio sp.]|nr:LysR family transcriptional regulator [Butyrivibrio sp.]